MSVASGIAGSVKQAGSHAGEAIKATAVAGKDMAVSANSRLAGHLGDKGVWGTIKHGAAKYPLVAGAAAVTGTYLVATKVMGPNERQARESRMGQEQGLQR